VANPEHFPFGLIQHCIHLRHARDRQDGGRRNFHGRPELPVGLGIELAGRALRPSELVRPRT
jgi:hypothetical protein